MRQLAVAIEKAATGEQRFDPESIDCLNACNGLLAKEMVNFDERRFELALAVVRSLRAFCEGFEEVKGGK